MNLELSFPLLMVLAVVACSAKGVVRDRHRYELLLLGFSLGLGLDPHQHWDREVG